MNRKNLIACAAAAVLAATTFTAQAKRGLDGAFGEAPSAATSTLTREEVLADVIASKQRLSIDKAYGAESTPQTVSSLTREEVRADMLAARADGRMDPGGEYSTPDSVIVAQQRYAQAQAAQLQARLDAERQQVLDAQAALTAQAAQPSETTAAAEGQTAETQPGEMGQASQMAQGAQTAQDPGTVTEPATPPAGTGDSNTDAIAKPEELSDQPADMPQFRPVDGEPVDRSDRTYMEADEYGLPVLVDDADWKD